MGVRWVFSTTMENQLLDSVWGADVYVEPRTVDVHIRRLRKALMQNGGDNPVHFRKAFLHRHFRHLGHVGVETFVHGEAECVAFRYCLHTPAEAKVLGPLILKEMHFRLLTAPHGGMLRNLIQRNSHASRITRAIAYIRQDFANPLAVADLADDAGMSASSFHQHFKSITAMTPLQYQKDLRLMEARRLLMSGQFSVSTTAYEVGYESPTQFSREYSRKFGVSPRRDRQQGADAVVKI